MEADESLEFLVAGFYLTEKCFIVRSRGFLPILVVVGACDLLELARAPSESRTKLSYLGKVIIVTFFSSRRLT